MYNLCVPRRDSIKLGGARTKSSLDKALSNPGICRPPAPLLKAVRYRSNLGIVLNYFSTDLEDAYFSLWVQRLFIPSLRAASSFFFFLSLNVFPFT